MTSKTAFYLLLALTLSSGVASAQQPAPDVLTPGDPLGQSFSLFIDGGGFLGVNAEDINRENMNRYGLRAARGVGVTSVVKDSPAERAGLRKDDVILRIDNEDVTSVRKLTRLVSEIAPDHTVKVTISRGGAERELSVTIGKREEAQTIRGLFKQPQIWKWEGPGFDSDSVLAFGSNRRIGVSTIRLTKQLADYFGVVDGKGVLVTSVTDDSPAAKAGIRAGDVITAIDGTRIEAAGDISRAINAKKDGEVTLTIIRNKSQQTIRVTPTEGNFPYTTPRPTQEVGRRIVIPRIEIPTIPEMNISLPSIQMPVIPEINIQIPRVIRPTKIRRIPEQPI